MQTLVDYARASRVIALNFRDGPPAYGIGRHPLSLQAENGVTTPIPQKTFIEPPELGDFRREVSAFQIFPPDVDAKTRTHKYVWETADTDLIMTTLGSVGKRFSETSRTATEIKDYADAMADMFCAYLSGIDRG